MKQAMKMSKKILGKKDEFDEDEKKVDKHLSKDIKESKKSISEDKKLKKALREEED